MQFFLGTALSLLCGLSIVAGAADLADYGLENMLRQWKNASAGNNLALNRPVRYAPTPDYHLTRQGNSDTTDLTDGRVIESSQEIWRFPEAVGWQVAGNKSIIVDLGSVKNVSKVVLRAVAGSKKLEFSGPKRMRVYGSLDGAKAALLADYHRESPDLAARKTYHLPNLGALSEGVSPYVYPVEIPVGNYLARYIVISFYQDSVWFAADELVVLEGTGEGTRIDNLPLQPIQTADVWIASPEDELPLVAGINLPLYFMQTDFRENPASPGVEYHFDLPDGVDLKVPTLYTKEKGRNSVVFANPTGGNQLIGPFFFQSKELKSPVKVRYHAAGDSAKPQPVRELTLYPAELPPPEKPNQDLILGIAWMPDPERQLWPDVLKANQALGFNLIPTFPSAWIGVPAWKGELNPSEFHSSKHPEELTEYGRQIAEFRRAGMKILMVYSPLHVINWTFPEARKEYVCSEDGAGTLDAFCISYTGDYYQKEIEAVGLCYEGTGGADYIMWDTELWNTSREMARRCKRCQEAFKKSGVSDFELWFSGELRRVYEDLDRSIANVAKRRGWKKPLISLYSISSAEPYECGMLMQNMPMFDFQNPSLYVGDAPEVVHDKVRAARSASGKNDVFPWLTTATYGYVSPENCKLILLENFFNGAFGGGYYEIKDFNPAQFLAVAEGFAALRPISSLLREGRPVHDEYTADDPVIRISAVRSNGRTAVLAVNPASEDKNVTIQDRAGKVQRTTIGMRNAAILIFE